MSKSGTRWVCQVCGKESAKPGGKCFECGEWNKIFEEPGTHTSTPQTPSRPALTASDGSRIYTDINTVDRPRISV